MRHMCDDPTSGKYKLDGTCKTFYRRLYERYQKACKYRGGGGGGGEHGFEYFDGVLKNKSYKYILS